MKLSKRQEQAINTAIEVMCSVLDNGIDSGESGELDFAIDVLIEMRDRSNNQKAREKSRREHLKRLLENSPTITLEGEWYTKNILSPVRTDKDP